MTEYICKICHHVYDEEVEEKKFEELDDDWKCPVCDSKKKFFKKNQEYLDKEKVRGKYPEETYEEYEKFHDLVELSFKNKSVVDSMGSRKPLNFSLDDLNFIPAQLNRFPLNQDEEVNAELIIGPNAKKPFKVSSPILMSAISYGAVSKRVRKVISGAACETKMGFNTGEGGVLESDFVEGAPVIVQYATGRFGISEEVLKKASAIEIKIGQGAYPGKGSFLPGEKIDSDLAKVRNLKKGEDAYSPARHPDISSTDDLKEKVNYLRKTGEGVPVGVKLACGNIEKDIDVLVESEVDYIAFDGFGGGTGATNKYIRDHVGLPIFAAIPRAAKYLEELGEKDNITLIGGGGLRTSDDIAKILALGADGVYLGTATLIGLGCKQYRVCHKGTCDNGITTNDPKLIKNLNVEKSILSLTQLMRMLTEELKGLSRVMGKDDLADLNKGDLVSLKKDLSEVCDVNWLGSY